MTDATGRRTTSQFKYIIPNGLSSSSIAFALVALLPGLCFHVKALSQSYFSHILWPGREIRMRPSLSVVQALQQREKRRENCCFNQLDFKLAEPRSSSRHKAKFTLGAEALTLLIDTLINYCGGSRLLQSAAQLRAMERLFQRLFYSRKQSSSTVQEVGVRKCLKSGWLKKKALKKKPSQF